MLRPDLPLASLAPFALVKGNDGIFTVEPPSILEQTPWEAGLYKFEDQTKQITYFNCGLVRHAGELVLVARRMKKLSMVAPRNSLWKFSLVNNIPANGAEIKLAKVLPGENFEDPRVWEFRGDLMLSYCSVVGTGMAHQGFVKVNDSLVETEQPQHVVFGGNGSSAMSQTGPEKNWIWFSHDGELHFVYKAFPHLVCQVIGSEVRHQFKTTPSQFWGYGEMRGGTPPVRVGDEYFSFFHSSLPWTARQRRYFMGAYAFEAKPPFAITRMTQIPLLVGSHLDPHSEASPPVVFPCGAIFENGKWFVVGGCNDVRCFWIKIPHEELLKKLC